MDTFIYILYGILILCGIVVFIRVGNSDNFIHPSDNDEMFDQRTVRQMYGDWDEDK